MQPEAELNFYSKADPGRQVGAGFSDIDAGLRLRYEISRKFAPYIGVAYAGKFGQTANIARHNGEGAGAAQFVFSIRSWFCSGKRRRHFGIAAAVAFIYTGVYDVSAMRPHWPLTYWAMDTVRMRSVKVRAAGITPPADLMDARIVSGTEHSRLIAATAPPGCRAVILPTGFIPSLPI